MFVHQQIKNNALHLSLAIKEYGFKNLPIFISTILSIHQKKIHEQCKNVIDETRNRLTLMECFKM